MTLYANFSSLVIPFCFVSVWEMGDRSRRRADAAAERRDEARAPAAREELALLEQVGPEGPGGGRVEAVLRERRRRREDPRRRQRPTISTEVQRILKYVVKILAEIRPSP